MTQTCDPAWLPCVFPVCVCRTLTVCVRPACGTRHVRIYGCLWHRALPWPSDLASPARHAAGGDKLWWLVGSTLDQFCACIQFGVQGGLAWQHSCIVYGANLLQLRRLTLPVTQHLHVPLAVGCSCRSAAPSSRVSCLRCCAVW
jgi:hypothetical protein